MRWISNFACVTINGGRSVVLKSLYANEKE